MEKGKKIEREKNERRKDERECEKSDACNLCILSILKSISI